MTERNLTEKTTFMRSNVALFDLLVCDSCCVEFSVQFVEHTELLKIDPKFCPACGEQQDDPTHVGSHTVCEKCKSEFEFQLVEKSGENGRAMQSASPKFCPNCGRQGPTVDGESIVGKENGGAA